MSVPYAGCAKRGRWSRVTGSRRRPLDDGRSRGRPVQREARARPRPYRGTSERVELLAELSSLRGEATASLTARQAGERLLKCARVLRHCVLADRLRGAAVTRFSRAARRHLTHRDAIGIDDAGLVVVQGEDDATKRWPRTKSEDRGPSAPSGWTRLPRQPFATGTSTFTRPAFGSCSGASPRRTSRGPRRTASSRCRTKQPSARWRSRLWRVLDRAPDPEN
jgi:hypothetical protein